MKPASSAYRPAPHVAWRRAGDEVVLLDLREGAYFTLNASGAEIWDLFGRGLSEDAAAAEMAELHGRPLRAARREVGALAARLKAGGLLIMR